MPNAEIYIMNDDGNTMKYLPLRSLEKEETKKAPVPDEDNAQKAETKNENASEEKATGEGGAKQ